MNVHLIDGTYELFRHYFGTPSRKDAQGNEVGALTGVLRTVLGMLRHGCDHIGVATDHVVESFRNDLWPGYKTGEGIEPELFEQFHPLENALWAMGVKVWPMMELEADDGLASAAVKAAADRRVEQVILCTPDKDLGQCVRENRIVQFDRRANAIRDAAGVHEKFGVWPESIPDYLALVGDSADGFPGLQGWGAKSAAVVLDAYGHIDAVPNDPRRWSVKVRGARRLAETLAQNRDLAERFLVLATLRTDAEVFDDVEELRWQGPRAGFEELAEQLADPALGRLAAGEAAGR